MPKFDVYNLGQARQQGQQLAQQEIKTKMMSDAYGKQKQSEQIAQEVAQQGYDSEKHAKALEKRGMYKEAFQVRDLDNKAKRGKLATEAGQLANIHNAFKVAEKSALLVMARKGKGYQGFRDFAKKYDLGDPGETYNPKVMNDYLNALTHEKSKFGAPKEAINPLTGKMDTYITDQKGGVKWLGITPHEKPKYGQPKEGINPETKKPEMYSQDQHGNVKWLGVQPYDKTKPPPFVQLQNERDKYPEGSKKWKEIDELIKKKKSPTKGMTVETSDGTVITIGGDTSVDSSRNQPLTSSALSTTQKDIDTKQDTMSHLRSIQRGFKPKYLEVPTRLGQSWDRFKEKFKLGTISPKDKKAMEDYYYFLADGAHLFSVVLKDISGVAVNPTEFKRTERWLPNVGTNPFNGDSPSQFKTKLKRMMDYTRRALIRKAWAAANGIKVFSRNVKVRELNKKTGKYETVTKKMLSREMLEFTRKNSLSNADQMLSKLGQRVEKEILEKNPQLKNNEKELERQIGLELRRRIGL